MIDIEAVEKSESSTSSENSLKSLNRITVKWHSDLLKLIPNQLDSNEPKCDEQKRKKSEIFTGFFSYISSFSLNKTFICDKRRLCACIGRLALENKKYCRNDEAVKKEERACLLFFSYLSSYCSILEESSYMNINFYYPLHKLRFE